LVHSVSRGAFVAAGAAAVAAPQIVRAQTLEKVRFTGVPTDDLTPVFYALKNGLYQKAGLDVEFVPSSSGTAATQAVLTGSYEIGKGSSIAAMVAHLRGLPLTIIGNGAIWDPKNPFTLILVAADSPYKSAADLNGKIASAAALNDLVQLAIMNWVDKNGGDSKTLKWVEIPNSASGASLAEHRTDVTMLNEPQLSAAIESGKARVLAPGLDAIAPRFSLTIYFAQSDWAAKHADVVRKWVRTTYEAATYTNGHHAETMAMMSDVTKIPIEVFRKMSRVPHSTTSDPSMLQPVIDVAAKYKNISRAFPAKEAYFGG
jgi:NitT/TauT family transport system substrate-binding protein